jgi:para-nitrobenzyl esterase
VLKDSGFGPEFIYNNIGLIYRPGTQYYEDLKSKPVDDEVKKEAGRRISRDAFFTVVTNKLAESHRKLAPTWRYYYEYTAENLAALFPNGPRHGDDILFTMNTGDFAPLLPPPAEASFTARDRTFAGKVSEYWFEFARTGVPVCANGPPWPVQTSNSDDQTKTLRLGETITVETDLMQSHMPKFEGIGVGFDITMVLDPEI